VLSVGTLLPPVCFAFKTASILTGSTVVVTTIVGVRLRERATQDESPAAGVLELASSSNGSPEKECS